ncbi:MAG: type II toxin-antitoxin system HicB family antitoxin [Limisphaerales bacterium]
MNWKLTTIIEKDQDGYFAYCPELKGCHTQGETREEALRRFREAAELYIESLSPIERESLASKVKERR